MKRCLDGTYRAAAAAAAAAQHFMNSCRLSQQRQWIFVTWLTQRRNNAA